MLKWNHSPGDNRFSQLDRNYSHHRRAIRSGPQRGTPHGHYAEIRETQTMGMSVRETYCTVRNYKFNL